MNTNLKNDRIIRALLREPVDCTPIWLMRQAGRYLPEYRALRAKTPDFMTFCRTPELAAQATLQPLDRFDLDAAIIFSDILVVPAAMGLDLHFSAGEGPVLDQPIREQRDIEKLHIPDVHETLGYVFETLRLVKHTLNGRVPLIGFAGSPWTCASYMVEGGTSKDFAKIKTLAYGQPEILHPLLQKITETTIAYLNGQIQAGADVIMLFDTWGGVLTEKAYQEFSLYYLKFIGERITRQMNGRKIPLIFFTKGAGQWLNEIADSGCDAVGLDWTTDIRRARAIIGDRVSLQGNLDPCLLFANPEFITQAAQDILTGYGSGPGHVFNLGHGILPSTNPEHVQVLIDAVHHFSKPL